MSQPKPTEASAADPAAELEAVREVLRAISESPFDLEGVLGIVVQRMAALCGADQASNFVPSRPGFYRGVATVGMSPEGSAFEVENESPPRFAREACRPARFGGTVWVLLPREPA